MSWQAAAWLLLGGSTALMFLGLPVAFAFLAINLLGAAVFLGGDAGMMQLARNSVQSVTSFALTPIPLFILMGEVLFHTGLAVKVIDGIEHLQRVDESAPLLAEQLRRRHTAVLEDHLARVARAHPELVLLAPGGHAGRAMLDDERGEPAVPFRRVRDGHHDHHAADATVGDERLRAVDDPAVGIT